MFNYLYKQIMKNLFYSMAFMLMGSVAFANSGTVLEKHSEKSIMNLIVENSNPCKSNYLDLALFNRQLLENCTITTDIKITKDGKTTTIKGTTTIEGTSCADLLKKLMS